MTSATNSAYSSSSRSGEMDMANILGTRSPHDDSSSASNLADHFNTFSPFPMGRSFGRSASAISEGQSLNDLSSSTDSQKHLRISPLDGLIRSQSAAPTMHGDRSKLGPPPGLNLVSSHSDSLIYQHQQRPASAGSVSRNSTSALRPAAKTLMDLIQEDFPN
jgi:hypothetical protein